ncbi:MAG: hypothetical protein ABSB76_29605 [Streptosporangiaceae bacterium]
MVIRRRIAEAYARNPDNWQARALMESVVRAEGDTGAGRPADVLALRRARFRASPALESYQALRQAATACGAWPSEREAALTALRDDARFSSSISGAQNGPALFDVLLDEGDLDAAWAAAERAVVTAPGQLIRLAGASVAARPADALRVYLDAVAPLTTQTGNEAYLQIARLLLSARDCHERLGTSSESEGYLAELRTSQRRKRALLRILDYNGL